MRKTFLPYLWLWLSLNLSITTAYDGIAVNGSYPKVLPRPASGQAVGYDESTNSILIFGGNNAYSGVIFNIDEEKFDDLGIDYMRVGLDGNNYYTMLDNYLWTIDYQGTGFIRIDTATRTQYIPSTIFPTYVSPHACLASHNKYLFVVGGWNSGQMLHIIQIYDINNDKWIMDAPLMQESRSQCGCIVNNDRLYVIAGLRSNTIEYINVNGDLNNITSRKWEYVNDDLQTTLRDLTVVNYEDDILILGGRSDDDINPIYSTTIPVVDTSTNTIYIAGSLAYGVTLVGCIIVDKRVYMFGGQNSDQQRVNSYQYIDVSPNNECIWKSSDGNYTLNVSSIYGKALTIQDNESNDLFYTYTPCSNSVKCNNKYAMAYLFNISAIECEKYLAIWEDGIFEPTYNNELGIWQFVYTNGESCGGLENVLIIQWVCDETVETAMIVKSSHPIECNYGLVINSALACSEQFINA